MSTLRNFQNEINEIRAKQRTQIPPSPERDKDLKKDKGKSKDPGRHASVKSERIFDWQEIEEQILVFAHLLNLAVLALNCAYRLAYCQMIVTQQRTY